MYGHCCSNIFPYWEGVPIEKAADTLIDHYYEVVNRIGNSKRVRISETGWPSSGPDFRDAVASLENQSRYVTLGCSACVCARY